MMLRYLFIVSCLCCFGQTFATGTYLGGSVGYRFLGELSGFYRYELEYQLYKNCVSSISFAPSELGGIFKGDTLVATPALDFIQSVALAPLPANVCVEVGIYRATVVLPQNATGYTFVAQRCCWTSGFYNLFGTQASGYTLTTQLPPVPNSSPAFGQYLPMFAVRNQAWNYDLSATDADNDVVNYAFAAVFTGGDPNHPVPNPPETPPYGTLIPAPSFSHQSPISINPNSIYDAVTGQMSAFPTLNGDCLVGIELTEKRNGQTIAQHRAAFVLQITTSGPSMLDSPTEAACWVYPNPFTECLNVSANFPILGIKLYDLQGRLLTATGSETLDTRQIPQGVYMLEVEGKKGKAYRKVCK